MSADFQPVPENSRSHGTFFRRLGIALVLLLSCLLVLGNMVYQGIFVHTPVRYTWSCSDSRHCVVTIDNPGGGFDHGFNPAVHWSITADPRGSVEFSLTSGTLRTGQTATIDFTVAARSCPSALTITSDQDGFFLFSPFEYGTANHQCELLTPAMSG